MAQKMTLEKLAKMLERGFAKMARRMDGFNGINKHLDKIYKHLAKIEAVLTR